jgi:hypothetical protein
VKRIALLGLVLLVFALAVASTSSAWYGKTGDERRRMVTVTSGIADVDDYFYLPGFNGTELSDYDLPLALKDYNQTETKLCFYSFDNTTNFTVLINDVAIGVDIELADGDWFNQTMADLITAGVDENATTITFNGTFNNSEWNAEIYFVAENAPLANAFINTFIYHQEDYNNSVPQIEYFWTVRDRINITASMNMTNVNLTIAFPDEGKGGLWHAYTPLWINIAALEREAETSEYIIWTKKAPTVDVDEDAVATQAATISNRKLTITFTSYDFIEKATWDLSRGDIYATYFEGVITEDDDKDLTIWLNDDKLSSTKLTIEDDNIILTNLPDVIVGTNEIIFEWYQPAEAPPSETPPAEEEQPEGFLYEEMITGIPNWATLLIVIVIIIAIFAVMKIEKK